MPASYAVTKLDEPLVLGSEVSAEQWASLPSLGPFGQHDGRRARHRTKAGLAYDEARLYLTFVCIDPDIWGSYRDRDDPIYNEEVVEFFLDVEGRGEWYYEFEVSPHNVVLDGINRWVDGQLVWDPSWDCAGMESHVTVRGTLDEPATPDQYWSVQLAIPFASLEVPTPTTGTVWRANLCRIDRHRAAQRDEFQAWCPTRDPGEPPCFNVPQRFGKLCFTSAALSPEIPVSET